VRAGRHEVKLAQSQQISKIQFGETYPDALAFMNTLPLYLDLPEALVVHGYFEPGLPLSQQRSTVLCGTMGGDKHLRTGYDRPWYELYDGKSRCSWGTIIIRVWTNLLCTGTVCLDWIRIVLLEGR
jgi:serine/threonine protein phosphatase 1